MASAKMKNELTTTPLFPERTLHNGVDLDQPAFLRKKIKLRQVAG